MIAFDNTEVAFKHKSKTQLKKAYWLFKMVGNPAFVKLGKALTTIAFKLHLPIKTLVKKTIFEQFCGGENISECDPTIALLNTHNIGTILDYSVEGKEDESDFEYTCNEIIATIKKANGNKAIPFSVFKITGISKFSLLERANAGVAKLSEKDKQKFEEVSHRVERICKAAYDSNVPVFIDAEESWIQNAIDYLAEEMMKKFNTSSAIVYNTIQLYRWDRLEFLKAAHQKAVNDGYYLGLKLVRGAYMEKERIRAKEKGYTSPIQTTKENSDNDYNLALEYCVNNIHNISFCAGTHNEKSSQYLVELIEKKGIAKDVQNIYFAQLLGMSDHISFNLSNNGYNVAKYVPYGPVKEVLPYLIRRAEENTSVAGQTSRELSLLIKERKRRNQ